MATLYPLPDLLFEDCEFDPIQPSSVDRMEGRRTEAAVFGTPYWIAKYRFTFLRRQQLGIVDAFMMDVQSAASYFLAYDIARPRPIAHDNGKPLAGVKAGGVHLTATPCCSRSRTQARSSFPGCRWALHSRSATISRCVNRRWSVRFIVCGKRPWRAALASPLFQSATPLTCRTSRFPARCIWRSRVASCRSTPAAGAPLRR